jgi:ubiquitin-protein ligase E3 A
VKLYADYLLNESVKTQFDAFKRGFKLVTSDSLLYKMFVPDELEQLICGTVETDLRPLEHWTEYDGGYTPSTPVIKWFWEEVHAMSEEDKKNLLTFVTGSHRVPTGGLQQLKLVISRHGDDSDK